VSRPTCIFPAFANHRCDRACAPAERDPLHNGVIVKRDHLQGRDYQLDLGARLNKTQVISNNTPLNQQARHCPRLSLASVACACMGCPLH
jgi:hypothetical protein